ncbi:MAG: ATP-dependent RecD-like DNA helicase [Gammaproteobacteria bacterium]|nr:ATP-dependent RecD-like DNA helicase [Gammaproteobacteria bacterium]
MDLSEDQRRAMEIVARWRESGEPTLTLGGYAGTGKTTLVKEILGTPGWRRAKVCALAGKAAYVLRCKGVPATTIHSLIYVPVLTCELTEKPVADCEECKPTCASTTVKFRPAAEIDASAIIVDEASMVNHEIYRDLLSFEKPILFVGDHGQLEPIGRNPRLMADPQIRLEKIHRQAESSPIIQFAHRVRQGFAPETCGDRARVVESRWAPRDVHEYDVVLCGKNSTRVAVNTKIRQRLGYGGALPEPGERVICLRNDAERKIFNGMQATVRECVQGRDGDGILMTVEDDLGDVYPRLPIVPEQFGAEKTLDLRRRDKTQWDFGYCVTVHKAQGSEWKRVCVLEWIHPEWSSERWRYTASTRASEELVYCVRR